MKLKEKLFIAILMVLCINLSFSQFSYRPNQISNSVQLTGEEYITGEDGVARMSINVWGHVKYPGTYLVYDGIDLMTCLSMAGGPLKGAKTSKISLISKDGSNIKINLKDMIKNNTLSDVGLKPYDTIYIDESLGSYLIARSSAINTLLQITNLILISTNN